jgi:hypothetical protein
MNLHTAKAELSHPPDVTWQAVSIEVALLLTFCAIFWALA